MNRLVMLAVVSACSSPSGPRSPVHFAELSGSILDDLERLEPADGVTVGHHKYDGLLPDRSPEGRRAEIATLIRDREAIARLPDKTLTSAELDDRDALLQRIHGRLFEIVELDEYRTNPMSYADALNLDAYIIRDYAPAVVRAAAVITMCRAVPAYLAQARKNVKTPIPAPWVDTALMQAKGLAQFADHDIRAEFGKIDIPLANQADINPALDTCRRAFLEHAAWLESQQKTATTAFALGPDRLLRMLAEDEGIELDLPTLRRVIDEDIGRNTAAITLAAAAIDSHQPVADVIARASADRLSPDEVLEVAQRQAEELRKFIVDHRIVTIPTDDTAIVRASPPFKRWNFAFLDSPGPFETEKLPAFYYVSPPDPNWSPEVQRDYIPARADLLFTTVHEVYPGHFVHGLHIRQNPSRVMQSWWFYATAEGWAHYTEEMMYDAGVAETTPIAHIGQLKAALLRDVRFLVALGEHTTGMTVDQATQLFRDRAFMDPGGAHQQAVRGTFDPMYLSYTLGKLIIRKLRDDWMKAHPNASLGEFHDAFLSHAAAPLPVIRRAMGIATPIL